MPANPIKILFIITQSEMGGAQRFMLELATGLNNAQFKSHIAAGPRGKWELLNRASDADIITHKLESLERTAMPWQWPTIKREIQSLVEEIKPDIVLLNGSAAGFLGALALRNAGIPVIYRIGGWAFNDPRPWWQRWLIILAEKLSARWKDVIIVNSESDRLQAQSLGIKPRKGIMTISNGLSTSDIDFFTKKEAREKLSTLTNTDLGNAFLLGNVANFYRSKAHDVLLKAFALLKEKVNDPSLKLALIGDGFLRSAIEADIKKHGLSDSVILTGQLSEARRYLKAFDGFVLSSKKEGFPWAILEAAAASIPIVTTDVGGNADFVVNGQSGLLVAPNDPPALAKALAHIIQDKELHKTLARGAHDMLENKFSKQKMILTFERLFEKISH